MALSCHLVRLKKCLWELSAVIGYSYGEWERQKGKEEEQKKQKRTQEGKKRGGEGNQESKEHGKTKKGDKQGEEWPKWLVSTPRTRGASIHKPSDRLQTPLSVPVRSLPFIQFWTESLPREDVYLRLLLVSTSRIRIPMHEQ